MTVDTLCFTKLLEEWLTWIGGTVRYWWATLFVTFESINVNLKPKHLDNCTSVTSGWHLKNIYWKLLLRLHWIVWTCYLLDICWRNRIHICWYWLKLSWRLEPVTLALFSFLCQKLVSWGRGEVEPPEVSKGKGSTFCDPFFPRLAKSVIFWVFVTVKYLKFRNSIGTTASFANF